MKNTGRTVILTALIAALAVGAGMAQSAQSQQNQQSAQKTSQTTDDQNTGVSHPPPDDTIQATEIDPQPEDNPPPPPLAKPSPATPAPAQSQAAAPAAPSHEAAPATVFASSPETTPAPQAGADGEVDNTDYGIVTVVPPAQTQNSAGSGEGSGSDAQNPDYGIVTSVPPQTAPTQSGWNANSAIVNVVPVDPDALGEGTNIPVRLSQDLSTDNARRGELFRAVVTQDVYNGSKLVIPAGSEMHGTVVYVSQGHHLGIRASMRLRPDVILLPDGTAYHLYAEAIATRVRGVQVNDEGAIEESRHYKKDAVEYGASTGAGAVAGAELGGPVGAGVGSVVGAGLMTTHMLRQPPAALDLPQGSVLIFSLTEPMPLTPTKN